MTHPTSPHRSGREMSAERIFSPAAPAPIGSYNQAVGIDGWQTHRRRRRGADAVAALPLGARVEIEAIARLTPNSAGGGAESA